MKSLFFSFLSCPWILLLKKITKNVYGKFDTIIIVNCVYAVWEGEALGG